MITHTLRSICIVAILFVPLQVQAQTFIPVNTESASARAHFTKGIQALDAARADDARGHFDAAIEADPNLAAAHLYRSFSATSGADFAAHRGHAVKLRESASTFVQLQIDISQAGMENDTEKQMELTQLLAAVFSNNPRAHVLLGDRYQDAREIAKARTAYNDAIELDGSFAPARKAMALSLMFDEPKNLGAARWQAQRYLNRSADEPDAYIVLGDVHRAENNFEKARDAYAQASEVNPTYPIAHSKRGHANSYLGDYDAARNDFKAAADVDPTLGGKAAMQSFGVNTYLYAGDVDGALAANAAVIDGLLKSGAPEADITFPVMEAYRQRGMIALHHGRYDEAKTALNKRAEWVEKAVVQVGTPNWANGMRADVVLWDGILAAKRGDVKTAKQLAAKNKEMLKSETNPRRYEGNHSLMAAIASAEGKYDVALEHLAQASVDWVWVKYETAVANEKAGNTAKAQEMYAEVAGWNFNSIFTALLRNDAARKVDSPMSAK